MEPVGVARFSHGHVYADQCGSDSDDPAAKGNVEEQWCRPKLHELAADEKHLRKSDDNYDRYGNPAAAAGKSMIGAESP
jgi:hypothetical protein